MERHVISVPSTISDKMWDIIGFMALLFLMATSIWYYKDLPEIIPRHFNAYGQPDGYSSKGIIWTLPVLGCLLYVGLSWLNNFPHLFNYPQKVTEENAVQLYTLGKRMNRALKTIISCVLSYMNYAIIQTALGQQQGLGVGFTPVILILIFGTLGYFLYRFAQVK